ncbi:hypothetical protein ACIA8K_12565 [Catenuloplanes sp. NPDC051500]|uniref:hypothetical protein n=1 Tax=Catenuloplanes sp. NPDC051500 TaxID=3363959 RepID=UPI0037A57590
MKIVRLKTGVDIVTRSDTVFLDPRLSREDALYALQRVLPDMPESRLRVELENAFPLPDDQLHARTEPDALPAAQVETAAARAGL